MPKTRKEFEFLLLNAFSTGMHDGYGVDHTDLYNEESKAIDDYLQRMDFKYSQQELINFANCK